MLYVYKNNHSPVLLSTSLSQWSVTRWHAWAARDCLASSLTRCVNLQQCIMGNHSVCANQFGTVGTRKKTAMY